MIGVRIDKLDLDSFAVAAHEEKLVALGKAMFDDRGGERRKQMLIDRPFQGTRAKLRRKSFVEQELERRAFPFHRPFAIAQAASVEDLTQFLLQDLLHQLAL